MAAEDVVNEGMVTSTTPTMARGANVKAAIQNLQVRNRIPAMKSHRFRVST